MVKGPMFALRSDFSGLFSSISISPQLQSPLHCPERGHDEQPANVFVERRAHGVGFNDHPRILLSRSVLNTLPG